MVPPEELEKTAPTTLPADFSEWDSGDDAAAAAVAAVESPARFKDFEAAPRTAAVARPAATTRVAAAAVADRLPSPPPRVPARSTADVAQAVPALRFRSADVAEVEDVRSEETDKSKQKMMIGLGTVGLLLAILIPLGYLKLHPKTVAVQHPAAALSTTNMAGSQGMATTATPKPSAAAPAQTAAAANAASDADAATQPSPSLTTSSQAMNHQLSAPSRIPQDLRTMAGGAAPPSANFNGSGMEGMGGTSGVFGGQNAPSVRSAPPSKVSISAGIAGGLLIQRSAPVYPEIAKEARVSGTVVLQATISKTGTVQDVRVVSGPTMLRKAAQDAVRTWRYRPYLLDGEPVQVETSVNVVFSLAD